MAHHDGTSADTFLHFFDAWIMWALENMSRHQVEAHEVAFQEFTDYCDDRFADADDLARAIARWDLERSGRSKNAKRTRSVLDDILKMWRAAEE